MSALTHTQTDVSLFLSDRSPSERVDELLAEMCCLLHDEAWVDSWSWSGPEKEESKTFDGHMYDEGFKLRACLP